MFYLNLRCNNKIKKVLSFLDDIQRKYNVYAKVYKNMSIKEKELKNEAEKNGNQIKPFSFGFIRRGVDKHRRNKPPSCGEIAAVFESVDGGVPERCDIIVHPKDGPLKNINYLSSHVDPMVYPNLFPRGNQVR